MRPQTAITNALKLFERVIILEDDCVPSLSFFEYCDELLEKYKDDERVCYISGLNHFEEWDCGDSDYFFTKSGAIWGWATWRRAWSKYYDYAISGVCDERVARLAKRQVDNKQMAETRYNAWIETNRSVNNNEKISYWDAQWGFVKFAQNMLTIVPKKNLIHNIGVGATSTHAQNVVQTKYEKYKNFVFIPTYELEFPLKHPNYCVCDAEYDDLVCKSALGNPVRRAVVRFIKKILNRN